jgi:hypothetical protein
MEDKLNKYDKSNIKIIRKITNLILKQYKIVYEMECNNKNNTDDYIRQVSRLKTLTDLEKEYYDKLQLDSKKSIIILKYLFQDNNIKDYEDVKEYLITNNLNDSNKELRRIFNNLVINIKEDYEYFLNNLKSNIGEITDQININDVNEYIHDNFEKSNNINRSLIKDRDYAYLIFLQKNIDNASFIKIKNKLIYAKYNMSFFNKDIERTLIDDLFEVNENLHMGSKMMSEVLDIPSRDYVMIKNNYLQSEMVKDLNSILNINNNYYLNEKGFINVLLNNCFLRATMLLMDQDVLNILGGETKSKTESLKQEMVNNSYSLSVINNDFDESLKDKELLRVYSFSKY